jgi:hypothetical protein
MNDNLQDPARALPDGNDSLTPLRSHPVFPVLNRVACHVGVSRDLIQSIEFLSLAAGKMVLPVNIDLYSEHWAVDLFVTNRITDLLPGAVARVMTYRQFRELEKKEFSGLAVILVQGQHRSRYRDFTEILARLLAQDLHLPSLWRISDHVPHEPSVCTTLRLTASQTARDLSEFGANFASYRTSREEAYLAGLLTQLPLQPSYPNPLRSIYDTTPLSQDARLVLERLLLVLAAFRVTLSITPERQPMVTPADYAAVRALLINLPLTPIGRKLSPRTLVAAEVLYARLQDANYQLALPDRSGEGCKWFTRENARLWIDASYTTTKERLDEMVDEGLLRSTRTENNRERGRQIHFRFCTGRTPPFEWQNPYACLPEMPIMTPTGASKGGP